MSFLFLLELGIRDDAKHKKLTRPLSLGPADIEGL